MSSMDETMSYIILRGRIDRSIVQNARHALDRQSEGKIRPTDPAAMLVNVLGKVEDWPSECQELLRKIQVSCDKMSI